MMKTVAILLSAIATIFGWITIQRIQLPYNSEGRFLDSENDVVYHSQAIPVFAIITGIVALAAFVTSLKAVLNHLENKRKR